MKKSLLATVAAVALFTTTGMVAAAEGGRDHDGKAKMSQDANTKGGAALKGKAETTGAAANGQAEPRAQGNTGPNPDSNEVKRDIAPKASSGSKANADKAKPATTGQGSAQKAAPAAKSGDNEKAAPAGKSAADEKSGAATPNASAQNKGSGPAGGSVALTSEQKTKIRTTVLRSGSAPKVSRSSINFNIRIGTVVPRSVHFVTVPETIVEIHPAWRGYRYFIVDDEIIIVEPNSFKIVAILTV